MNSGKVFSVFLVMVYCLSINAQTATLVTSDKVQQELSVISGLKQQIANAKVERDNVAIEMPHEVVMGFGLMLSMPVTKFIAKNSSKKSVTIIFGLTYLASILGAVTYAVKETESVVVFYMKESKMKELQSLVEVREAELKILQDSLS